ncbi:MAG: type II toxin-antitoxin system RelE/ParE family toxin [Candidatus Azobacteroides sp.]|nr:type II toxin-antitoxin system RelE/ParE family toxin [Candidatus Azobacteroides sp.]
MKISWTKEAVEDLDIIYQYYKKISPVIADRIYDRIITEAEILMTFPEIASIEPLLADKKPLARSLIINRIFKVIYYLAKDSIIITNIWDCRQNPELLKENLE